MRSLPVLLPAAIVLARGCPLASIRQIRTWRLSLVERDPAEAGVPRPAGWGDGLDVEARPRSDEPHHDRVTGAVRWSTTVTGDGFRAHWEAPSAVRGPVRVRGDLVVDPLDGRPTTGRILRVRVVTEMRAIGEDGVERVVALRGRDRTAIPTSLDPEDRGVLLDLELNVA